MAVWGSPEAGDPLHTHTHTHVPGIWTSQGHRWKSARCTGTEHSCPCRQQWALWTPEQMPGNHYGGGKNLPHTPTHTKKIKIRTTTTTQPVLKVHFIIMTQITNTLTGERCNHLQVFLCYATVAYTSDDAHIQLRVIPLSNFWAHAPPRPAIAVVRTWR